MIMRFTLAALASLLVSCSSGEDFSGSTYKEMVSRFGAPRKTNGWPEKRGACVWLVRHEGDPKDKRYRIGGNGTESPAGYLVAHFVDGVVVKWEIKADDNKDGGSILDK